MAIVERVELDFVPETRDGYVIPVVTDRVEISQGYNGPYSHFAVRRGTVAQRLIDSRFAIDFQVPFGTQVIAAKKGFVSAVIDSNDEVYTGENGIGLNVKTNFILLKHPDDSYTLYSHLAKRSVVVGVGQEIIQRQLMGITGSSGWIGPTPHLHFEAFEDRSSRRSFPVRFDDYKGTLEHTELEVVL